MFTCFHLQLLWLKKPAHLFSPFFITFACPSSFLWVGQKSLWSTLASWIWTLSSMTSLDFIGSRGRAAHKSPVATTGSLKKTNDQSLILNHVVGSHKELLWLFSLLGIDAEHVCCMWNKLHAGSELHISQPTQLSILLIHLYQVIHLPSTQQALQAFSLKPTFLSLNLSPSRLLGPSGATLFLSDNSFPPFASWLFIIKELDSGTHKCSE